MCGIFGVISTSIVDKKKLSQLVKHSQQRGKDSSGLIFLNGSTYNINRADYDVDKLLNKVKPYKKVTYDPSIY